MFYHFKMFHKTLCNIFVIFCLLHVTKALRGPVRQWQKLSSPPETKAYPEQLHSQILDHFDATNPGYKGNYKGTPQLIKSLSFSFWPKFSGPPPPFLEKEPYRRKCWYFVPNSNYKAHFFQNFKPIPLFHQKAESHLLLRWPLST